MRGGQVGTAPVVKPPDEQMHLRQPITAFFQFLKRLRIVSAPRKIFSHTFEGSNRFLDGLGVSIDALCHLQMHFTDSECSVWGEDMVSVHFKESGVLNERFGVLLLFEVRFSTFDHDVGVIISLDSVFNEDLFIRAGHGLSYGAPEVFGSTGASGEKTLSHQETAQDNRPRFREGSTHWDSAKRRKSHHHDNS
jgi:hypothetical protein